MTIGGKLTLAGTGLSLLPAAWLTATMRGTPAALIVRSQPGAAGLLAVGGLLIVSGCLVYVVQPAVDPAVARRVPYASVRTSVAMFVAATAVANLLSLPGLLSMQQTFGIGGPGQRQLGGLGLTYLIVSSELPILGVVWLRLVRSRLRTWRELGARVGDLGEQVSLGLAGGLVLFLSAAIVSGALARIGLNQNQLERFQGIQGAPLGLFIMSLLAGCVLAPFVEELFFRGYVFQSFLQERGPLWAYLFSAAMFAVVHANLAAAVPIFVLGLILANIFHRSGSIVPGMIAHGLNNAIAFMLLYSGLKG